MAPGNFGNKVPLDLAALADLDDQIDVRVLGNPAEYSLDELIEQTGWSGEEMAKLWLWAGLPPVDSTHRIYTKNDVEGLTQLKQFVETRGLDEKALSSLIRSLGSSMERLALWQVEAITQFLARVQGLADTPARLAAAGFAPGEGKVLLEQVNKLWLRHYAAAVHRLTTEAVLQRGVSDDDQQFPLLRAVGYARIVDFTEHTAAFGVAEYAEFVQDFHDRVADVVNLRGGRVIKNIGDSVLYIADDASAGASIALHLAQMDDHGFGARVQVALTWCRVLSVYGDVFGPGVNLAVLLASETPPGEVYADQAAAAMLARQSRNERRAGFELTDQPVIEIKGLGAVRPTRVRLA